MGCRPTLLTHFPQGTSPMESLTDAAPDSPQLRRLEASVSDDIIIAGSYFNYNGRLGDACALGRADMDTFGGLDAELNRAR